MKDFIKNNIEKVTLIVVMLVLVVIAVVIISTVDVTPISLVDLKGNVKIQEDSPKYKSFKKEKASRLDSLFDNADYITCRNIACNNVFHDDFKKCPWCGTTVKKEENRTGGDKDGDGIPDSIEAVHNLDPNNPDDAKEDFDGDAFTNYDEIMVGIAGTPTLIDDASSYPSLVNFVYAKEKRAIPLPFIFKTSNVSNADKARWEIQFMDRSKRTRWLRVGASLFNTDYKLVDIAKQGSQIFAVVKADGEERVMMNRLKKAYPPNSKGVDIYNNLFKKKFFVSDGSAFDLEGKDGVKERIDYRGVRKTGEEGVLKTVLFSRKTNEEFEIDNSNSILTPVK